MEVRPWRLFCNWERFNRAQWRNHRESCVFLHDRCTEKLKTGGILSVLHRPSAYGLWFTMRPDVPSRKEASAIVLIMLLFALSFKANYPLDSFSPSSQVSPGKHSWYEDPWNSSCENANPIALTTWDTLGRHHPPIPPPELKFRFGEDMCKEK